MEDWADLGERVYLVNERGARRMLQHEKRGHRGSVGHGRRVVQCGEVERCLGDLCERRPYRVGIHDRRQARKPNDMMLGELSH